MSSFTITLNKNEAAELAAPAVQQELKALNAKLAAASKQISTLQAKLLRAPGVQGGIVKKSRTVENAGDWSHDKFDDDGDDEEVEATRTRVVLRPVGGAATQKKRTIISRLGIEARLGKRVGGGGGGGIVAIQQQRVPVQRRVVQQQQRVVQRVIHQQQPRRVVMMEQDDGFDAGEQEYYNEQRPSRADADRWDHSGFFQLNKGGAGGRGGKRFAGRNQRQNITSFVDEDDDYEMGDVGAGAERRGRGSFKFGRGRGRR